MLEQNPFLETDDEAGPAFEPLTERLSPAERVGERKTERAAESSADGGGDADAAPLDGADFGGTEREDWENGTEADDFDGIRETPGKSSASPDGDEFDSSDRDTAITSLQDHLREQLSSLRLSSADADAVMVLIESLNDDGYLADSLADIAEQLTAGLDDAPAQREALLDRLQCGLRYLQSMEPTGVGARDPVSYTHLTLPTNREV